MLTMLKYSSRQARRTALLILGALAGLVFIVFVCIIFLGMSLAYTEKHVSIQVGGYRIDLVRKTDLEFITLYVEALRPDGKKGGTLVASYYRGCPDILVQRIESRLYFLCSDETITNQTIYFDITTMGLYFGAADNDPKLISQFFD